MCPIACLGDAVVHGSFCDGLICYCLVVGFLLLVLLLWLVVCLVFLLVWTFVMICFVWGRWVGFALLFMYNWVLCLGWVGLGGLFGVYALWCCLGCFDALLSGCRFGVIIDVFVGCYCGLVFFYFKFITFSFLGCFCLVGITCWF